MKTQGRRKSTNIVDARAAGWATASPKGDRLRKTPERSLPVELKGTSAMNAKLSIESFKASRRGEARRKAIKRATDELAKQRNRKPKG